MKRPILTNCFLLFITLFLYSASAIAQAPVIEWQKVYGSQNGEYPHSIEPTSDGGYIVAGYTENNGGDVMGYHGNPMVEDCWVLKLDKTGSIQWQRCIGGLSVDQATEIHQTPDGGYIMGATSGSTECDFNNKHGGLDYWLVKLDPKGNISWQKSYGGHMNEYCYGLSIAPDGGYYMVGETESSDGDITQNKGYRDVWVIKTDQQGNLQWQKTLGGSAEDEASGIKTTTDGGCIIVGYTLSNDGDVTSNHGKDDVWVIKLSPSGTLQWQKTLGGSSYDEGTAIQCTPDGGYIVAAFTGSNDGDVSGNHFAYGPNDNDFWLVKLSPAGNILWQKCYGGNFNERPFDVQNTQDGGFVLAGYAESKDGDLQCNAGIEDIWIVKTSANGTLQWQKSIGGSYYEEAYSIKELKDGSFIVCGETCSKEIPGYHLSNSLGSCGDYYIIKLSAPASSQPQPQVSINKNAAIICQGTSVTIPTSVLYAGNIPTYSWTKNGTPAGVTTAAYTASDLKDGDVLQCTVSTGGECGRLPGTASDQVTIKVNTSSIAPVITITADNSVLCNCAPVSIKASVTNGGGSPIYQWMVNGAPTGFTSPTFTATNLKDGDNITCVYSDNLSCIAGGHVTSNSIQITAATGLTATVNITASLDTICAGTSVTFTASPQNAGTTPHYQWKINASNTGADSNTFTSSALQPGDKVTCTITPDPLFVCTTSQPVTSNPLSVAVTAKAPPSVTITTTGNPICEGTTAAFTAQPSHAGYNPSCQWQINGTSVGTNTTTFSSSTIQNGDIVSCLLTADPAYTCTTSPTAASNTITMQVNKPLQATLTINSPADTICAGTTISFTATAQNAGIQPAYQWMLNQAPVGNNTPVYTSANFNNGDQLYCMLSPDNSCNKTPVSSNTVTLTIHPLPLVTITPADTAIKVNNSITLQSFITSMQSFVWTPAAALADPTSANPTTLPLTETTSFSLTATSAFGCTASATATIKVFRTFYMPSAFTPNADGRNDHFRIPPYSDLSLDEFTVFNRWGQKLFTTHDISQGWDGTLNGLPAPAGVYVYFIKGTTSNGKQVFKGTFILLR